MNRRAFLKTSLGAGAAFAAPRLSADGTRAKPPFRILFSNDMTNIESCPGPIKRRGEPFTADHLRASVAETAGNGIDVHLLQPGLGWVPWWTSDVVPMRQHVDWLKRQGRQPNVFETFVLNGGDPVRTFIDACRAHSEAPFISIRLNDAHHIYRGGRLPPEQREKALAEFQFFADHPEYRLGPDAEGDERMRYMLDWGRPEVRDYKLRLIEELCRTYDLDGLELDFMRHWIFFNLKRTTPERRREIQTDFVRSVRRLLDRHARPGRRRWLCVRVPSYLETYGDTGIELAAMRRRLPDSVALYAEVQFVSATAQKARDPKSASLIPVNRRTTPEQFYTVARQAYAEGADGISAFNFQYYRGTYNPTDVYGAPAEPPYGVFKHLADHAWLARQPQHYFVGQGQGHPKKTGRPFQSKTAPGETAAFALTLVPPEGGWRTDGRLRIQAGGPLSGSRWTAQLNGADLAPTADVSEPYPGFYPVGLGAPEDYRAWTVPAQALKAGENRIAVTLRQGPATQLTYLDLSAP